MLLDIEKHVTPEHSRSHLRFPFRLERPAAKLNIRFSYTPKVLEEDAVARRLMEISIERYIEPERQKAALENLERYLPLQNLITVSVDDADGYRGACHRHDPAQQLYLSENGASPGLIGGRIGVGDWAVTLSVHSVVTESCACRLEVWVSGEEGFE
ncbi:hypothetical protein [Cohnella sp. JJ-181]|uniref:hypothetical protein n=1 Tax=Cohnella rhizoplanae TaxID=2974897 RepID=UPI0022FFA01D|nr:hypothetical protein [Cohnella sp. JJ-181]CAI6085749.1 hypothetical protein COHCIP112018_04779 [Cohnella sp. JJ-181]